MEEKNNVDWRETMGAPFEEAENPEYDVSEIRKTTTDTPAHAEMFNGIFQKLIDNIAAVKKLAESKAAQVPEFEEAETLENIQSGDSMPGILGKLKKWFSSFHPVAWSGKYGDLAEVPTAFPPGSHNHDDRYFTETEITTKLAGKSDTSHTHTAAQVGAAASNHTHNYAGLDESGRVPVAQLPVTNLTLYLSPNGVDAPNRGTEAEPLKTIYYAINTFSTPTRILNLQLNPGSYGWVGVGNRWVSLAAVDPNNKPILTGMEVDQLGFASLVNCKIQGAVSNGDAHVRSFGKCSLYNVDFMCTGGTGNSSGVQIRGGDVLISGCTFSGYRQTVISSYAPVAPALVISRNNSGTNPSAYAGVLVAVEGVIIWRQGTQPTGVGGTTTVVTENGGQVYGG